MKAISHQEFVTRYLSRKYMLNWSELTEVAHPIVVGGYERNLQKSRIKSLDDNNLEEPLPAGGSCLLASVNLSQYVTNPFTDKAFFDFNEFKKDIKTYVKEMNVVLDEGLPLHPLPEQRESVTKWRQIGLGILGLADAFIKLGIAYGSDESLVLADAIARSMAYEGIKASALLAKEDGAYPGFDKEAVLATDYFKNIADEGLTQLVSAYGLRNSQILTIAPTGSN